MLAAEGKMRLTRLCVVVAALTAAEASAEPTGVQPASNTAQVLQAADAAFSQHDYPGAERLARTIVSGHDFDQLDADTKHDARELLGLALFEQRQCEEPSRLFERNVADANVTVHDWQLLAFAAHLCRDDARAAEALAAAVRLDRAEGLSGLRDVYIAQVAHYSRDPEFLGFLVNGSWRPADPTQDLSSLRLDLVRLLLEQHRIDEAREIAQAIIVSGSYDLGTLIILISDRAFDPITTADPHTFDISAILDWQLANARAHVDAQQDKLAPVNDLARALYMRNRLDEAKTLLENALHRIESAPRESPPYSDLDAELVWTHNQLSDISDAQDDPQQALERLRLSAQMQENGQPNVSQRLNYAAKLEDAGRGAEALAELEGFDESNASPYGAMVVRNVRACSYAQMGNTAQLRATISDMRTHAADSYFGLTDAALCAHDDNLAAETFLRALRDPAYRGAAILRVQTFIRDAPISTFQTEMRERWHVLFQRPDVQREIERAAHINSFPIRILF
jgi:hypothetical protein